MNHNKSFVLKLEEDVLMAKRITVTMVLMVFVWLFTITAIAQQEKHDTDTTQIMATVNNPDPTDRLNLRTKPSKQAPTLGKYYNGTTIEVLGEEEEGWVKVRFGNLEGYMQGDYLAYGEKRWQVKFPITEVKIENKGGKGLNLRQNQSIKSNSLGFYKNGEMVYVYGVEKTWCHVQTSDGKMGFMLRKHLSPLLGFVKGTGSFDYSLLKQQ